MDGDSMATITYKRLHDTSAVGEVNRYISDGHGDSAPARTNRYISDEHGGESVCVAYNCPRDPATATAYMETLRQQYERLHPGKEKSEQRKDIVHLHFFLSFAEHEDLSVDEMLEIADTLLKETPLGEYASRIAPHTNTWRPDDKDNPGNKHLHISLCPYSLDGTHKLSMIHNQLWDVQKKLDYICAAHGYSIITKPVLLADPEYREWFERIAKEGKVKIHPQEPEAKKKRTNESRKRNAASVGRSSARAIRLMQKLDIRSKEELERHIKGVGSDIAKLRQEIARQSTILERMGPLLAILNSSEGNYTPSAKAALKRFRIETEADIADVRFREQRATERLAKSKQLLAERNAEYGKLKAALKGMTPPMWAVLSEADRDSDEARIWRAVVETEKHLAQEEESRKARKDAEEQSNLWYTSHYINSRTGEPYRVYRGKGRPLSLGECIFQMAILVTDKEYSLWMSANPHPTRTEIFYAKPNYKIQRMLDAMMLWEQEGIRSPQDLDDRIALIQTRIDLAKSPEEKSATIDQLRKLRKLQYNTSLAQNEQFIYGPEYTPELHETKSSLDDMIRNAATRTRKPREKNKERDGR